MRQSNQDVDDDAPTLEFKLPARPITVQTASLPDVLNSREAATALRMGIKELRQLIERGELPAARLGPRRMIRIAEPQEGEKRQFRFIVSPEDARQIDLRAFARELVSQMEKDLGRPLVWAAVNHHNTDHSHVHIVVRGLDGTGKELRIPPRYIQQDMRARAQQLLTRELGVRTDIDIACQRRHEVDQERLTSIDRALAERLTPVGHLDARAAATLPAHLRATLLARLATLGRGATAHGRWDLGAGWQLDLTKLGLRNDIIKRLHQVAPGDPSPKAPRRRDPPVSICRVCWVARKAQRAQRWLLVPLSLPSLHCDRATPGGALSPSRFHAPRRPPRLSRPAIRLRRDVDSWSLFRPRPDNSAVMTNRRRSWLRASCQAGSRIATAPLSRHGEADGREETSPTSIGCLVPTARSSAAGMFHPLREGQIGGES